MEVFELNYICSNVYRYIDYWEPVKMSSDNESMSIAFSEKEDNTTRLLPLPINTFKVYC